MLPDRSTTAILTGRPPGSHTHDGRKSVPPRRLSAKKTVPMRSARDLLTAKADSNFGSLQLPLSPAATMLKAADKIPSAPVMANVKEAAMPTTANPRTE